MELLGAEPNAKPVDELPKVAGDPLAPLGTLAALAPKENPVLSALLGAFVVLPNENPPVLDPFVAPNWGLPPAFNAAPVPKALEGCGVPPLASPLPGVTGVVAFSDVLLVPLAPKLNPELGWDAWLVLVLAPKPKDPVLPLELPPNKDEAPLLGCEELALKPGFCSCAPNDPNVKAGLVSFSLLPIAPL